MKRKALPRQPDGQARAMKGRLQQGADDMNPRSCIVSRKRLERNSLIRFVSDPNGRIIPDLKETLPGRGVWIEARKSSVEAAVSRGLFARGMKAQVQADKDLADLVETLLTERALQALAMAKKAGLLVAGFAKVDSAIRTNRAALLLHATDAAQDGRRKLASAVSAVKHMGGDDVATTDCLSSDQMSAVLGLENATHAAALHGGATRSLIAAVEKLEKYRADGRPDQ